MYYSKLVSALICVLDFSGLLSNFIALVHIYRSFNLKIHIFALLFVDSIISTACSIFLAFLHILSMTTQVEQSKTFCTFEFLGFYLPSYLGACLTFLVASIRYLLAIQSAQNKHPSNVKVWIAAFAVFGTLTLMCLLYIGINTVADTPFSFMIETCANTKRNVSHFKLLTLQFPNNFNVLSLILDLLMIRHVRKSVAPQAASNSQPLSANSGKTFFVNFLWIILLRTEHTFQKNYLI
jgi:hypothetical protein